MGTYPENELWGRQQARQRYGREGMVGADRAAKFKNAGSEMTHKYPDTAQGRGPTCMAQDSPNCSMEKGQGGDSRIKPVEK